MSERRFSIEELKLIGADHLCRGSRLQSLSMSELLRAKEADMNNDDLMDRLDSGAPSEAVMEDMLGMDTPRNTGTQKASQEEVNYREAQDPEGTDELTHERCGTCRYFYPEEGACQLVEGSIGEDMTCDLYRPDPQAVTDFFVNLSRTESVVRNRDSLGESMLDLLEDGVDPNVVLDTVMEQDDDDDFPFDDEDEDEPEANGDEEDEGEDEDEDEEVEEALSLAKSILEEDDDEFPFDDEEDEEEDEEEVVDEQDVDPDDGFDFDDDPFDDDEDELSDALDEARKLL